MIIKKHLNNTRISFYGYKGADNYGTPQNREALKYKVSITPQKIDEIIKQSETTDEGLIKVYNSLKSENKNIHDALRSLDVIVKHYLSTAKQRFDEIGQKRPYGSKIPVVGLLPDAVSKFTDGFIKRIEGYTDDLIDDFSKIIDDYFHSSLNKMILEYRTADSHFKGGIEYVNSIQGETPDRKIMKESLAEKRKSLDSKYKMLEKNLRDLNVTIINIANEVIKKQTKKQNTRLTIKVLIKIVSAGHG